MTSQMVTAVDFIKILALFQIWKLSSDKYLSFIVTHFLLKIDPKSSLQLRTVLFSDRWWGIAIGVLNYNTFFHHKELQNSGKVILRKTNLRLNVYLASKCQPSRVRVFEYSLVQKLNPHIPGVRAINISSPKTCIFGTKTYLQIL